MSTFLQLCADLRREVGASGTGPTSVLNQTGEYLRLVKWTIESYREIQNAHRGNWRWLRSEFTLPTVADDDEYAYSDCTDTIASATITRFARWHPHDMKVYLTSAGVSTQTWLTYSEWDDFKRVWKIAAPASGFPAFISVDPRNKLRFGPKPDAVYTITGEYQKSAQVLAADADVPEMPEDFHRLIVLRAMKKYAAYESAPEIWAEVKSEYALMMRDLEVDQLPEPKFGDALA